MRISRLLTPWIALLPAPGRPTAETSAPTGVAYAAEIFAPGVVSTRDYERDGTFSPDGKTFYFTKRTIWPYFSVICVSRLRDGRWGEPEVASFSGRDADLTPFISGDGNRLYFASRRPLNGAPATGYNLWVVDRTGDRWSAPRSLPAPVNGQGSVIAPVETRNGSLYFITGDVPHTFVARKVGDSWTTPVSAGDESAPGSFERAAYVDPDERYMIVSIVGRSDALESAEGIYARGDLYARERVGSNWSPVRHLDAPINSGADEGSPFVSPDGRYLYFTTERGVFAEHGQPFTYAHLERALHSAGNGLGDIYRVDFRATGLAR